ncbi:MAG TPA: MarP family serine protease [Actinomycetota bacterium]
MNALDLLLIVLLALSGVSGYRRGFTLQAFGFGGLLIGLVVGALLAPFFANIVDGPNARAGLAVLVLLAVAALGNAAGWFIGVHARHRAASKFAKADSVAGSAVAVVASLLAIWFLALNLANGPFPAIATEIRGSAVVRTLDAALPQPPSLLAQVRRLFNRFAFPDVFSGIPPLPAEPVRPPSQAEARAAAEAAAASTLQVIGPACDVIQEGSGFVAAEGYVVTNAHVVAGMDDPEVRSAAGRSDATTVLFDPDLDLAILSVPGATGPPLPLATEPLDRGAPGAVLGYPQGGPLDVRRAAVRRTIDAVGRDIYGHGEVERLVLELQTLVRPGNSGGPFVLPDGRVAGVVFAASSGDDDVGYAIAADEVQDPLRTATGQTTPVDTGPCIG